MSNEQTVKEVYAAFKRGDVAAILARVADDVDWRNDGVASHECPWNGKRIETEWHGPLRRDTTRVKWSNCSKVKLLSNPPPQTCPGRHSSDRIPITTSAVSRS